MSKGDNALALRFFSLSDFGVFELPATVFVYKKVLAVPIAKMGDLDRLRRGPCRHHRLRRVCLSRLQDQRRPTRFLQLR